MRIKMEQSNELYQNNCCNPPSTTDSLIPNPSSRKAISGESTEDFDENVITKMQFLVQSSAAKTLQKKVSERSKVFASNTTLHGLSYVSACINFFRDARKTFLERSKSLPQMETIFSENL